jgi:subtilisin family serine protease
VLKDDASVRRAGRARSLVSEHKGRLGHVYDRSGHGFSAAMSEAEATRLAADPDVAYVEQDQLVRAADTEESPPWNLDRIDQRGWPVDNTYSYDSTASNVTAYLLDSGIRITNTDFGGRASYGWDFIDNDAVADDCNGHGTNVAGEPGAHVLGGLQQTGHVGGFEHVEQAGSGVEFGDLVLMLLQAAAELSLHSACCTSRVWRDASRSAAASWLLVARVQARMSSSLGVCLPFSILETFEACHVNDSASSLPDRPACWRSSRSRAPSVVRAW